MTGDQDGALPVHVTNMPAGTAPRRKYRAVYATIVLTAAGIAEPILAASDSREYAWIQPLDDDIVISGNQGDAAAGSGAIIPKTIVTPYRLTDSGAVYAAAPTLAGATSRVSVVDFHRV